MFDWAADDDNPRLFTVAPPVSQDSSLALFRNCDSRKVMTSTGPALYCQPIHLVPQTGLFLQIANRNVNVTLAGQGRGGKSENGLAPADTDLYQTRE